MSERAAAARVLAEVLGRGRSLDALSEHGQRRLEAPLARELVYGVLRWQPRLEALLAARLWRRLPRRDTDVYALLLTGLYQLIYLRVPDYASVAATVEAARELDKPWATGLVNGVLRAFLKEREAALAAVDRDPATRLAHPEWLLQRLQAAYPDDWEAVAAANNAHPPLTLRVNARRTDVAGYRRRLEAAGLGATPVDHAPRAITVEPPVEVAVLPGFHAGDVSVQDAAAQLAAPLLEPGPGQRLLDACAAPGGKTGHLLEMAPDGTEVVALDRDNDRLRRVAGNLARLGLEARLVVGDAGDPEGWWDGRPFARVLADVPCSATGVVRRHPDIKLLRRAADIPRYAERQARLLDGLWRVVAPGGMLLYATCSVLAEENEQQAARFLDHHGDATEAVIAAEWGMPRRHGRQILPGQHGMDGFYYVRFTKTT